MPGKPSIVFTRFTGQSPKLDAWKQHSARVVGLGVEPAQVDQPVASAEGIVVWYLKSANNRMLGKSAGTFLTFEEASAVASRFVNERDELTHRLVAEGPRLAYGWVSSLNGVALVTCARWYETERDRRNSLALALGQLDSAAIGVAARPVPSSYRGRAR